jgi:hypothetical protein
MNYCVIFSHTRWMAAPEKPLDPWSQGRTMIPLPPRAIMAQPRVFTLEEANALVPTLHRLVGRQMLRQSEIEDRLRRLARAAGRSLHDLEIDPQDSAEVRSLKTDLMERIAAYEEGWREVTSLGAVVKDVRTGLVDFYGQLDGRTVWLCWRYGEERIDFFHELDTGFAHRKPLGPEARQKLLN